MIRGFNLNSVTMRKHLIFIALIASLFLSGCVYQIDIEQGNIVTQEMVDQLEPNMNKRQVRYVMGTPLVVDVFHQDRWDYVYSNQPGGEDREQKRITLMFNDDRLTGIQGDMHPLDNPAPVVSKDATVIVPRRELDKTLWETITSPFYSDE